MASVSGSCFVDSREDAPSVNLGTTCQFTLATQRTSVVIYRLGPPAAPIPATSQLAPNAGARIPFSSMLVSSNLSAPFRFRECGSSMYAEFRCVETDIHQRTSNVELNVKEKTKLGTVDMFPWFD
jgi:hypothetical protein